MHKKFPDELQAIRSKANENVALIMIIDSDVQGVARRKHSLNDARHNSGVKPLSDSDPVLICVPTWNIETWLAFLQDQEVDETP